MADQVRISVVIAEPRAGLGQDRIFVGLDYKYIRRQILASTYRDLIHVEPIIEPNARELQFELAATSPHVVHFACHGSPNGIVLRSVHNDGDEWHVDTDLLVSLIRETPSVRMVVLNSCETREVGTALRATTDFVVAMNQDISDGAATAFASSFYLGLAQGKSVDKAFLMGRTGSRSRVWTKTRPQNCRSTMEPSPTSRSSSRFDEPPKASELRPSSYSLLRECGQQMGFDTKCSRYAKATGNPTPKTS